MRWLGSLLIWGSLGVGTLAAVTAYRPSLEAVAASSSPLTLNAPAGKDHQDPTTPLVSPDGDAPIVLSRELVDRLRAADVHRVGVREFAFSRWSERYWFLAAIAGLVAGAVLMRRVATNEAISATDEETKRDPVRALNQAAVEIDALIEKVASGSMEGKDQLQQILDGLDVVQSTHFETFIACGPQLIRQLGLSRYAQLMDRFAAAQRRLYRAWSAAADQNEPESLDSLRVGRARLYEALERLPADA